MKTTIFFFMLFNFLTSSAQDSRNDQTQRVGFIVIYSTDNFEKAEKIASQASNSLNTEFDNSNFYDEEEGLTDTIVCGCGNEHGYIARGRYDEGDYLSIELSSWFFEKTEEDAYLVIAASYPLADKNCATKMKEIQKIFPNSYYFEKDVYIGCMH
jgi:hypothetical protein